MFFYEDEIKGLKERTSKFQDYLEFHLEDKNAIEAAIKYFEYVENLMLGMIEINRKQLSAALKVNSDLRSLHAIKTNYLIDNLTNEKEAQEKALKCFKRVMFEGYNFDSVRFYKNEY